MSMRRRSTTMGLKRFASPGSSSSSKYCLPQKTVSRFYKKLLSIRGKLSFPITKNGTRNSFSNPLTKPPPLETYTSLTKQPWP